MTHSWTNYNAPPESMVLACTTRGGGGGGYLSTGKLTAKKGTAQSADWLLNFIQSEYTQGVWPLGFQALKMSCLRPHVHIVLESVLLRQN